MNKEWHWDSNPCDYDINEDQPWLIDNNGNRILWGEIHCDLNDNACLIAAAPELLEALEAALPLLHAGDELPINYYKDKPSVLGMALRAIAKAKGES